jgi:hypothetical protein
MIKTNTIVIRALIFSRGKIPDAGAPTLKPKAIENRKLIKRHKEKTPLFLDERPIDIEYIDAVIARVASEASPFIFHDSIIKGNKGTSICKIMHVKNSVDSSEIPSIGLRINLTQENFGIVPAYGS